MLTIAMDSLLIIEDEEPIRHMIRFILAKEPFQIIEAGTVSAGLALLESKIPKIILLDWMLPDKSGIAFLRTIRSHANFQHIPVIMLTARAQEDNKIKALESGADDYITKPFSPKELKTRIQVILRRGPILKQQEMISSGDIEINTLSHSVSIRKQSIKLTPIEYKLLLHLVTHQKRVHSREQLITHIWGNQHFLDERSVDVQIKRLRKRLEPYQCAQMIKTVRGFGYQFESCV
jgi:two-component system phosphate regulon response regulator PhoB